MPGTFCVFCPIVVFDRSFLVLLSCHCGRGSWLFCLSLVCATCAVRHCFITKTCLYNYMYYPIKPNFYIVKLGFTWYTLFSFYFLLENIDCG